MVNQNFIPQKRLISRLASVVLAFVLIAATYSWYSVTRIDRQLRAQTVDTLSAMVDSTHEFIQQVWLEVIFQDAVDWASNKTVTEHTEILLAVGGDQDALVRHPSQAVLRQFFDPLLSSRGNRGMFIISPQFENLASMRDENLSYVNIVKKYYPRKIASVFNGQQVFIPPIPSEVRLKNNLGIEARGVPTMFIAVPIKDAQQDIIAALLVRLNPFEEFSAIPQNNRFWDSGETYLFDKQGRLLTKSRFEAQLVKSGLIAENQTSVLNVQVREPNLVEGKMIPSGALTLMVKNALSGISDRSLIAYPDYRGVPVIGAWKWDEQLGIGIASEVDEKELLKSQWQIASAFAWQVIFILLLGGGITFTLYRLQKKNLSSLIKSEDELRSMIDNAAAAIITFEPSGKIRSFNRLAETLFGCIESEATRYYIERFFPKMINQDFLRWRKKNKSGVGLTMQLLHAQDIHHHPFPTRVSISRHTTVNGVFYTALINNLSKLHLMEDKLLQLKSAVEQSDASILIADLQGVIEYANSSFSKLSGISKSELQGKNTREFGFKTKPLKEGQDLWRTLQNGEPWYGELSYRDQDGQDRWLSAAVSPIKNREFQVSHFLGILEDITPRKLIEAEVIKSRKLLEEAERIAKLGSWEWDVSTDMYSYSKEMFRLMGMQPSNEPVTFEQVISRVKSEDRFEFIDQRKKAIFQFHPYQTEFRVLLEDKSERVLSIAAEVQRDKKGNPIRLLGIARDITQLKIQQKEQEKQNIALENSRRAALSIMQDVNAQKQRAELAAKELEESQKKLEKARIEAESASEAKSRFLATMSHEIRTPMNGVVGMLDLLQQSSLNKEQNHLAKVAKSSAIALLQIINDVLDFSKVEAGKMTIESIPFRWSPIVESSAELLAEQVRAKNIKLYCLIDPQANKLLLGDPVRLRQIVLNLLGNAVKFTNTTDDKTGEIIISVKVVESHASTASKIRLTVSDNGIGMSSKQVTKLFKPFTQADDSTHRKFGGTGLGLSICMALSELMDGQLSCESELNNGTAFHLELPLDSVAERRKNERGSNFAKLNLVLVDSDEIIDTFLAQDFASLNINHWCVSQDGQWQGQAPNKPVDTIILPESISEGDKQSLLEKLTRRDPQLPIREVVLYESRRFDASKLPPHSYGVDINPFIPEKIYNGIAIACGLRSPEMTFSGPKSQQPLAIPSINQAEQSGQLILVVEDNVNNQEVITRQLKVFGYASIVANNGQEALGIMKKYHFGLVFSDCHMPVMDGFEFTKAVRKIEKRSGQTTPIVATTANAMQGEAEKCLAIGMNDFVTKPIELKVMQRVLAKWLPKANVSDESDGVVLPSDTDISQQQPNEQNVPVNPISSNNPSPIDKEKLKLYLGEDENVHRQFIERFILQSQALVSELGTSTTREGDHSVAMLAHKLKSSSRAIGATLLGELCEQLENATNGKEEIKSLQSQVVSEFDRLCAFIKSDGV